MPTPIKRNGDKTSRSQPLSGAPRTGEMRDVKIPRGDPDWHPRAKALFASLKSSGQSDYYQNSDWQIALIACDLLSYCYKVNWYKCTMLLAEINTMLTQLGVTEGARRQTMRVELEFPVEEEQSAEENAIDEVAALLGRGYEG